MDIYLPVAAMSVNAESIFLLSAFVGFLSGALGIGGGFLSTPFLIFFGIPPGVAVATQAPQLVASGFAGVSQHYKRGHVDLKVAAFMLIGGFVGAIIGGLLFRIIESMGQIDLTISVAYVVLLGGIGITMSIEIIKSFFSPKSFMREQFNAARVHPFIARLPYKTRFPRSKLYVSALVPMGIGAVGGVLASVLGIGGGFILVPAMIYLLGMPTLLVVGTSLFQLIFTTGFATIMHATVNQSVDIILALILIIGGVIGAQFGASFSVAIKPFWARVILASIVMVVAVKLSMDLFMTPEDLFVTYDLGERG